MSFSDTHPKAEAIQNALWRNMSGEARVLLAFEMSMLARELSGKRIQREHPEWSERQVTRELLRLAFLPAPLPNLR